VTQLDGGAGSSHRGLTARGSNRTLPALPACPLPSPASRRWTSGRSVSTSVSSNAAAREELAGDHVALILVGALADDHQRGMA
jgi:hypothetical protein